MPKPRGPRIGPISTKQNGGLVRYDSNRVRLKTGESQVKNGSYVFRWTDRLGKRRAVYAPTLADLREKEEQILVDKHDHINFANRNLTINEVYDRWCELKRGIKDNTFRNYKYMYEMFVKPYFGRKRISEIRKSDVRMFYNSIIDDRGVKIATLDNIHNVLHQVFQLAVDDDLIRSNPSDGMLKELKMANSEVSEQRKALTVDQQKLFTNYLQREPKAMRWYPVFYIMMNTGMRVGELTGLRWCDVDFDEGLISVNHTLIYYNHDDGKGLTFSINTPKTKAGVREIPMTEGVKKAFMMEKEYQELVGLSCKVRIDGYEDFIFVNKDGGVQHQGSLNKVLRRLIRDCNCEVIEEYGFDSNPVLLPRFSCHILRHTFATRLCESGINLKVIQDVLGHADVTTTMNIYINVTNDLKKKEMLTFVDYLNTGQQKEIETQL